MVLSTAAFPAVIIMFLWNGTLRLNDQGAIGLLIDVELVIALLIQR